MTDRLKKIKAEIERRKKLVDVQADLSKRLKMSQAYLSLILNGKRPIPKHREADFDKEFNL